MHNAVPAGVQTKYNSDTSRSPAATTTKAQHPRARTVNLPPELLPLVTTVRKQQEIYSVLKESRDRRVRLYLRRFTNQIQYGCKNPHCDVPTCLSYRRRHAHAPVRQYSDVAARALAWQCVEEYGNGIQGIGSNQANGTGQKRSPGRSLTSNQRCDGLCWNDPVVPWYENPVDYFRRCRIDSDRQSLQSKSPRQRDEQSLLCDRSRPKKLMAQRASNTFLHGSRHKEDLSDLSFAPAQKQPSRVGPLSIQETTLRSVHKHSNTSEASAAASPPDVEQLQNGAETSGISKDEASFSQMFYDVASVRSFDSSASCQNQKGSGSASSDINPTTGSQSSSVVRPAQHPSSISNGLGMSTLSLLPISALVWLRHVICGRSHVLLRCGTESDNAHSTVEQFTEQSLRYCLSDPRRLIRSAQMWRGDCLPEDLAQDTSKDLSMRRIEAVVSNIATAEGGPGVLAKEARLPSVYDALSAFYLMSKIGPYIEVLDHVFDALQHAYHMPPSLGSVRNRNKDTPHRVELHSPSPMQDSCDARFGIDNNIVLPKFAVYLDDEDAAYLCMITLYSLTNYGKRLGLSATMVWNPKATSSTLVHYTLGRRSGQAFAQAYFHETIPRDGASDWRAMYEAILVQFDGSEDSHFLRLLNGLADVISHRLAVSQIMRTSRNSSKDRGAATNIVEDVVRHMLSVQPEGKTGCINEAAADAMDLMSIVLLQTWDREPVVRRTSPVGGALQMLSGLYRNRARLGIEGVLFRLKFVSDAFDDTKMPLDWMTFREDNKNIHILSFAFLFEPGKLVKFFRTINAEAMRKSFEYASLIYSEAQHFLQSQSLPVQAIPVYGGKEILTTMRPHMARYFVLTVGRHHMLEDAINQLWRRQRQELTRPLKVSIGKGEGEDGLDHGGVSQEFFRVVFAEAMNPAYGMFTTDEQTRMLWFQPAAFEPLYKFEAIGILMSLAVYNGITLPVTLPLAFYRKLLGLKVKHLEHIEDGWPVLAKSLKELRDWSDGDVGDVIMRTYEFSYDHFDTRININMAQVARDDVWPYPERRKSKDKVKTTTFELFGMPPATPPSEADFDPNRPKRRSLPPIRTTSQDGSRPSKLFSILASNSHGASTPTSPTSPTSPIEAPLVTNANRYQYVKDYIYWLTTKSISPQYEAFSKGFFTCLDPTALSMFTPEALKTVIEGYTEIDIAGLEETTTYDDFSPSDPIIQWFWQVVRDFSPDQHRKLLEFVTASDRVPVTGVSSVVFIVQRNGEGDTRLPSSSTCYGRLLLPAYSSKEVLRVKLEKAVENSVGFGTL